MRSCFGGCFGGGGTVVAASVGQWWLPGSDLMLDETDVGLVPIKEDGVIGKRTVGRPHRRRRVKLGVFSEGIAGKKGSFC